MESISLSYFVDFVLRSGTPKLTGVKEFKENKDEIYTDFYKSVREAIVEMHQTGLEPSCLDAFVEAQTDTRRCRIYPGVVAGYQKFLRSGKMKWFEPPTRALPIGGIALNVNPEVGLVIDGTPHAIKLYFRSDPLSSKRVAVIIHLLTTAFATTWPGTVFSVLDVRNAKLHSSKPNPRLNLLLRGEAAAFSTIYTGL
jgi:hypothetical protein